MNDSGRVFDKIAEDYDLYRLAYPAEFIQSVLATLPDHRPGLVCEIGSGSGQATIRLADLGYTVTGIEPGQDLLTLANKRLASHPNTTFICSTFEQADLNADTFDLVFAANAFHWVCAKIRFVKAHTILKPGGHLLAVWRWDHPLSGSLGDELNKILTECVPGWKVDSRLDYEEHVLSFFRELIDFKMFLQCQLRRIPYDFEVTSEAYSNWLSTMAMVAELTPKDRMEVCSRIRERIDKFGGKLVETGETVILTGRKPVSG